MIPIHQHPSSITLMSCHLCHAYVSHSPFSPSSLPPRRLIIPDVTSPYHHHPHPHTPSSPLPLLHHHHLHFPVTNTLTWHIIYKVFSVIFEFIAINSADEILSSQTTLQYLHHQFPIYIFSPSSIIFQIHTL